MSHSLSPKQPIPDDDTSRQPLVSCEPKHRFLTVTAAKSAMRRLARIHRVHGCHYEVYRCMYCDGYHVGKSSNLTSARRRARLDALRRRRKAMAA